MKPTGAADAGDQFFSRDWLGAQVISPGIQGGRSFCSAMTCADGHLRQAGVGAAPLAAQLQPQGRRPIKVDNEHVEGPALQAALEVRCAGKSRHRSQAAGAQLGHQHIAQPIAGLQHGDLQTGESVLLVLWMNHRSIRVSKSTL